MMSLFSYDGQGSYRTVLGVHVTRGEVRAALVRRVEGEAVLVDRFHRYRGDQDEGREVEGARTGDSVDGGGSVSETEYTIEFGSDDAGGAGGGDEFGGPGGVGGSEGGSPGDLGAGAHPDTERNRPPFAEELKEIVTECTEEHGSGFDLVFLNEAWATDVHRLAVGDEIGGEEDRDDLLRELLERERGEKIDSDRLAFERLAGARRSSEEVLTLIRREEDSVVSTVEQLRSGRTDELPGTLALLGESTLFGRLVGEESLLDAEGTLALVRVGADDTLVLFFEDGELVDQELLKSLSVHDPPDTVCKRVLLHQDEAGIEEPERIWVLAEGREEAFVDRFAALNPTVEVRSFFDVLGRRMSTSVGERGSRSPALFGEAQALGWLVVEMGGVDDSGNLLPPALRGRRSPIRLGWHTWAAAVLLFGLTLFLATQYQARQDRVSELNRQIQQYPSGLEMTTEQLQSRIDSLDRVYTEYRNALNALDSLLVDSDRWSRMLARVVRMQDRTPGVWFEKFSPDRGERVELQGYATERDRVVDIANRLDAAVEQIVFDEIRTYPVYRFTMSAPLPGGLPRAVQYLRERDSVETDSTRLVSTES